MQHARCGATSGAGQWQVGCGAAASDSGRLWEVTLVCVCVCTCFDLKGSVTCHIHAIAAAATAHALTHDGATGRLQQE
jgi:hypothetical protein